MDSPGDTSTAVPPVDSPAVPPAETPILVQGHFTGTIKMVDKDDMSGKEMKFENFEFKFDTEDKINEIATNLNDGKTVMLGPEPTTETVPASSPSAPSSGGKSIKKRVRKNRKTKKHGNKKYRNKK